MSKKKVSHVMRWFTCEWRGLDSDEEYLAVFPKYLEHVAAIRDDLVPGAAAILELDLHDGQVQEWSDDAGLFVWRILIGDLQRGYQLATITYSNTDLLGMDGVELTAFGLMGEDAEILHDEIDVASDGRTDHRFLSPPYTEFGLRFSQVSIDLVPASSEQRR